jgi:alpha-beta hydrolase superfamily lysophospholipase
MGGGVALIAAAEGMDADALVLAGPAIAGGPALSEVARGAAWTLAAALPDKRWTGQGFVHIRPTDNPEAIRRVLADPRHFGDPSSRELFGLVRLMDRAAAEAPRVAVPTLTLMGAHDEVLEPERVEAIAATIPGSVGTILYPDGWHWLFTDRQAARVWKDVGDFALGASRRGE